MGPLTESMQRLSGEIVSLRGKRLAFVRDLGQEVAAQMSGYHQARAQMARQSKTERQNFVKSLATEVAGMRAGFRRSHQEMARETKAARRASVAHLKSSVASWKRNFAGDLAGAHRAWFGPSPEELMAKAEAERRQAEAVQKAKEAAERERQLLQTQQSQEIIAQPETKEDTHRSGKKRN